MGQIGIPTVNKLTNQLITRPLTANSTIQAAFSYSLFFRISITMINANPMQRLAIKNSNEAIMATLTIHMARRGSFYRINSIALLMNFTNLSCCSGYFSTLFITFTLLPNSSIVSSRLFCTPDRFTFWGFGRAEAVVLRILEP